MQGESEHKPKPPPRGRRPTPDSLPFDTGFFANRLTLAERSVAVQVAVRYLQHLFAHYGYAKPPEVADLEHKVAASMYINLYSHAVTVLRYEATVTHLWSLVKGLQEGLLAWQTRAISRTLPRDPGKRRVN